MAGSWLFCCSTCGSWGVRCRTRRDIRTSRSVRSFWPTWMSRSSAIASINSWVLTAFSRGLAGVGVELLPRAASASSAAAANLASSWSGTVDGVVHRLVDLGLHDGLRQRHLHEFQQRLEGVIADLLGLLDLEPPDLLLETAAKFLDGVEFAAASCAEFVVGLGQLPLLDRLEGDGDLGLLASVLTGDQLGGERLRLALGQADDRVVETVDELAGADLVGQSLGLGVGGVLTVDRGGDGRWRRSHPWAGRSTPGGVPKRARSVSSSVSTSSSVIAMGSTGSRPGSGREARCRAGRRPRRVKTSSRRPRSW